MGKKNKSKKKQKDITTASNMPVDKPVKKGKKKSKKAPKLNKIIFADGFEEILENTSQEPEIVLDTVPAFDEEIILSKPVDKPVILEPVTNLVIIPDRWYIKLPEDNDFDPILNFYKDNTIIASFPLNEENLNGIMPMLEVFYERPEPEPKESNWGKTKKWMKKHKFTAFLGILIGLIVVGALLSSAFTALGFGSI